MGNLGSDYKRDKKGRLSLRPHYEEISPATPYERAKARMIPGASDTQKTSSTITGSANTMLLTSSRQAPDDVYGTQSRGRLSRTLMRNPTDRKKILAKLKGELTVDKKPRKVKNGKGGRTGAATVANPEQKPLF